MAEFIGTFFLCFAGIAAILSNTTAVGGGGGLVAIALAHGLALSVAVNAFGGVSGAHFNPAVTAGMLVTGRITPPAAVVYIVAQLAGATSRPPPARRSFPPPPWPQANLGIPLPAPWATTGTVVLRRIHPDVPARDRDLRHGGRRRAAQAVKIGGFGIGLTVAFDILAGGPVTGASMNPARSFGPALVQGYWEWHHLYWIAPIAGGVVAALVYRALDSGEEDLRHWASASGTG